jgi:hypothetical protein
VFTTHCQTALLSYVRTLVVLRETDDNIVGIKWTSTGTIRHRCSVCDSSRSSLAVSPRDRQLPVSILMLCICTITPQAVSVSFIRLWPVQWSWSPSWTCASSAKRNGKTGTTDCEYFFVYQVTVVSKSKCKSFTNLVKDSETFTNLVKDSESFTKSGTEF